MFERWKRSRTLQASTMKEDRPEVPSEDSKERPGHDAPIWAAADDCLGSAAIAKSLLRMIRGSPRNWSTRIGLYGRWGSGKTSVLNLLEKMLEANPEDRSIVVKLSAWRASGQDGVLALFYEALSEKLSAENIEVPWAGRIKKLVEQAGEFAAPVKDVANAAATASGPYAPLVSLAIAATGSISSLFKVGAADLKKLHAALAGRRVVVFVDDLDRADPKTIPKALLAMRELLDWPDFSFVLAFDKAVVSKALGEYSAVYGANANAFLEKIIDIPFELPTPTESQQLELARRAFSACCDFIPKSSLNETFRHFPKEPRRIKLISRTIGAMRDIAERHDESEIDWRHLILLSILREASSPVTNWLVALASQRDVGWADYFGGKEAREKWRADVAAQALTHFGSDVDESEKNRIKELVVELVRIVEERTPESIAYEAHLATQEPCITWREFRIFVERWPTICTLSGVKAFIFESASKVGSSNSAAGLELINCALTAYSRELSAAAEAGLQPEHEQALSRAKVLLEVLEYLWKESEKIDGLEVCRSARTTKTLLELGNRWLSWTRNTGEPELRNRERALIDFAVQVCGDKAELYSSTDPYWESNFSQDERSQAMRREWLTEVRGQLKGPVIDALFEKFLLKDGLEKCLSGDDKLSPWLLESPKSPLYTERQFMEKFLNLLRSNESDSTALSANAQIYIFMLFGDARMASWGGGEARVRELATSNPQLLLQSWLAVIAIQAPYRMRSSLRTLRERLIECGMGQEDLIEPSWLLEE